ncbi:MAG: bifunctional folylpolyglutamate synthase/dihydrofolate synthase [Syntrophomonadaceae bacterium]
MCRLGIKPGLERITALLEALGNPHKHLRAVHVAGTNGKGSTALIIARVLAAAGYRTGRYSSPHMHSYCERFEIDDRVISPGQLHVYLQKVLNAAQSLSADFPSEFEILTAIAFLFFREEGVDIAVLETGMGGSYDATTIAFPCLCVITGVDYDHTAYLGDSLPEIAANKAGIIKPGIPVVIGPMQQTARQVIEARAARLQSPVVPYLQDAIKPVGHKDLSGQLINIQAESHAMKEVWFSLPGLFQLHNLAVALTALSELEKMSFVITDEYIRTALGKLHLAGRLEMLKSDPLIIADVAHNRQGAQALQTALAELLPGRKRVLLIGIVDDKDAGAVLQHLGQGCRYCVITRPEGQRSQQWARCAEVWQGLFPDIPCRLEKDIAKAVDFSRSLLGLEDYLLVTGSFYVLDRARQHILAQP